uniref:Uncharacterized protein n=2 Tax=Paracidobacterium acidisoli TaxID=2303751 RepID=A0A372IPQ7_9BACT
MQKSYALFTGTKGQTFLAQLPAGTPVTITAQSGAKEQIALSPSCSAALLYAQDSAGAVLITGLPAAPQVQTMELPSSGSLTAAAVSDAGMVLAAFGQPGGEIAIDVLSSKSYSTVTNVATLAGMTFIASAAAPQNESAVIADGSKGTVWLASNLTSAVSLQPIAGTEQGVSQPSAIAASADGRWLTIANLRGTSLMRIDLTGQTSITQTACRCAAANLRPLSGNSTFLLSDPSSGPAWVFNGDAVTPRTLFIPGVRSVTQGAAQ